MEGVAENMFRKQGDCRSQTGFNGGGCDDAKTGRWRYPPGCVFVEMLPFGIKRPMVNRFYDLGVRCWRGPESGCQTDR